MKVYKYNGSGVSKGTLLIGFRDYFSVSPAALPAISSSNTNNNVAGMNTNI